MQQTEPVGLGRTLEHFRDFERQLYATECDISCVNTESHCTLVLQVRIFSTGFSMKTVLVLYFDNSPCDGYSAIVYVYILSVSLSREWNRNFFSVRIAGSFVR